MALFAAHEIESVADETGPARFRIDPYAPLPAPLHIPLENAKAFTWAEYVP
ncbi:hypothetical protein ACSNOJ_17185 [Streptomyces sp. URMC 128]